MTEKADILFEIVKICHDLDCKAFGIYSTFATKSADPVLAGHWKSIAAEEREHMRFWEKACDLCRKECLSVDIDEPEVILERLTGINRTLKTMIMNFNAYDNPAEEVMFAYTLEAYILDPSFMKIFNGFKFIDPAIEDTYDSHITRFIELMRECYSGVVPLQIQIMGETLHNLYLLNKSLSRECSTDSLTGLFNRRGFFHSVKPYLGIASRNNLDVGIIMIDLDNFKRLNDTYGHPAGDKALRSVALLIESGLRESDISGRYGGEEFIVFAMVKNDKALGTVCEKIRKTIERNSKKLAGVAFTASLGAASGKIDHAEEQCLAALIEKADRSLYRAKSAGKNCWQIFGSDLVGPTREVEAGSGAV